MKPPICELCGKDFRGRSEEGALVSFADFEDLPEGMVGHPKGMAWFCGSHYRAAQALRSRSMAEAVEILGKRYRLGAWLRRILTRIR